MPAIGLSKKGLKAPRFDKLSPASAASSRAKQANRSSNTQHEQMLRRSLWNKGLRFRKNLTSLPGKPDIVFVRARVAIFCDGDFWHGNNWRNLKSKFLKGSNADYWTKKIKSNRRRDRMVNAQLQANGWLVIRVWESDIFTQCENVANEIAEVVKERQAAGTRSS